MKNSLLPVILIAFLSIMFSCSKDDDGLSGPEVFKPDTALVEIDDSLFIAYKTGSYNKLPVSMAYDSITDRIFFYKALNDGGYVPGFEILQYDLNTESLVSVYTHDDPLWYNSNGSEGRRLFIYNNELWIPGGATNGKVFRLAIGDNSASFLNSFDVENTDFGNKKGYNPYDIAEANGYIYIQSMSNYVFYASYSTLTSGKGNFETSAASHGSSIVSVFIDNTPYLAVKCAYDNKIELFTVAGVYVRGVPVSSNSNSQLVKDSRQRIYFHDPISEKIIRYAPDLLLKEEFPAEGFNSYTGITLKEESDRITLFCRYRDGLGKISLPK
jgi:hypothetical protein